MCHGTIDRMDIITTARHQRGKEHFTHDNCYGNVHTSLVHHKLLATSKHISHRIGIERFKFLQAHENKERCFVCAKCMVMSVARLKYKRHTIVLSVSKVIEFAMLNL